MGERKPRLRPRFMMVEPWDIEGFESWLADQSARGMHFRRHNPVCLWFAKGEPRTVRYRLDVLSPLSPTPDGEKRDQAAAMGWRYLDKLGDFSVYACDDPTAPELHTDPVTQSYTMDALAKRLRLNAVLIALLVLAVVVMVAVGFGSSPFSVYTLVEGSTSIAILLNMVVYLYLAVHLTCQTVRFFSVRRRLRLGLPLNHRRDYRAGAHAGIAVLVLAALFAGLSLWSSFLSLTGREAWNVTAQRPSPIAFELADLEAGTGFAYFQTPANYGNHVRRTTSFLAPVRYDIHQAGGVPGDTWPDGRPRLSASMTMAYYELRVFPLAGPLMEDLVYRETVHRAYEKYTVTQLEHPGFDALTLARRSEGGSYVKLFARAGGRVIYLTYDGTGDLLAALPALAEVLA